MDIKNKTSTIFAYFSEMQDFRIDRKKQHLLTDIITITIAAASCGIESYNDIEDFGVVVGNLIFRNAKLLITEIDWLHWI